MGAGGNSGGWEELLILKGSYWYIDCPFEFQYTHHVLEVEYFVLNDGGSIDNEAYKVTTGQT